MGLPEIAEQKLATLPTSPGVYVFRGKENVVLYVGKAKSLRSRVRSYFQSGNSDDRFFIPILREQLTDLETFVTKSEKEAAILENNLIKEYRPRFNVKLRDDKEYLSLKLDATEEWPRLRLVRRSDDDAGRHVHYFGPFDSATAARRTVHLVNKHFQLRTCSDSDFARRKRPCLQHQIKRCPAPCVYEVSKDWYREQVRAVDLFLAGRHDELSREVEEKMGAAAESLEFELAAVYRDQLRAVARARQGQRALTHDEGERDVIGIHREETLVELALLIVRGGRLADVHKFSFDRVEVGNAEVLAAFLSQYYGDVKPNPPEEILLPLPIEGKDGVQAWLSEQLGRRIELLVPERGAKKDLVALATENAAHAFLEKRRTETDLEGKLGELRDVLRLAAIPRAIECCDISHLGGDDSVGAVVAMTDGQLDKKRYRSFHVKGRNNAPRIPGEIIDGMESLAPGDDYGAMYEVLSRRFRRGRTELSPGPVDATDPVVGEAPSAENDGGAPGGDAGEGLEREVRELERAETERSTWTLPDLFVVDGGRGQLAVALAAARDLGLHDLCIVALAKEKENVLGETLVDRVYLPGQKNPIPVRSSSSLVLLARLRDEAHRFSNKGRVTRGDRRNFRSALEDVRGIGKETKKRLLSTFGGLPEIRAAKDEELRAAGLHAGQIRALRATLGGNDGPVAENEPPSTDSDPPF